MKKIGIVVVGIGLIIMVALIGIVKSLFAVLLVTGLVSVIYQRFFHVYFSSYSSENSIWTKSRSGEVSVKSHWRISSLGKRFPVRDYFRAYPSSYQRSASRRRQENVAWSLMKKLFILAVLAFLANQFGIIG